MAAPDIKSQLAVVNEDVDNRYNMPLIQALMYYKPEKASICQTKLITCLECDINEQNLSEVGMCSEIKPLNE